MGQADKYRSKVDGYLRQALDEADPRELAALLGKAAYWNRKGMVEAGLIRGQAAASYYSRRIVGYW